MSAANAAVNPHNYGRTQVTILHTSTVYVPGRNRHEVKSLRKHKNETAL
jgi:hypothetical protein